MKRVPAMPRRLSLVPLAILSGVLLAGCATDTGAVQPVAPTLAPPQPTVAPTQSVAFAVAVTPQATPKRIRPLPRPIATRFVVPPGPYLVLSPNSGPPVSRAISIRGGNFPRDSEITLSWFSGRHFSTLSTNGWTDRHGSLKIAFVVPATPPGSYKIRAEFGGLAYAISTYRVRSYASVQATVAPDAYGDRVTIEGHGFVPKVKLLLVAYPLFAKQHAVVLGTAESSNRGQFSFHGNTLKLLPGQYALRVWTMDALAAQVSDTYFQVVA